MIAPDVRQAIEELKESFTGHEVAVEEDGDGGAYVTVGGLDPGSQYTQRAVSVSFRIGFQYPASDVYPHFMRPRLARVDRSHLTGEFQQVNWRGIEATQVSRRSNHWDRDKDTAAVKLGKVLEWVRTR